MSQSGPKNRLRTIHRYVSLALLAFWVLQCLSGLALVYARTLDDLALGATAGVTSATQIDHVIHDLSGAGIRVEQYFISGGVAGQVDVLGVDRDGVRKVWRIDGTGRISRVSAWLAPLAEVAVARLILIFHKTLLAGEAGRYLVILSGACLLVNLGLALKLVWPRRGRWRAVLRPTGQGNRIKKTFEWHRAIGAWVLPVISVTVVTGLCLSFLPTLERWSGSEPAPPASCLSESAYGPPQSARAVASAKAVFADAGIVSVTLPGVGSSCYKVQMHRATEQRRVFGTTVVFVEPRSFRVAGAWDALDADLPVKVVVALYTVHTGEWAGAAGRVAVMLFAGLFLSLMVLGFLLWWRRRRALPRPTRNPIKSAAPHP